LLLAQLDRRFDHDAANQIANMAAAHVPDALAAQAEQRSGLRFRGNLDRSLAAERGHLEFGAERRLRKADRRFAEQIVAFALKNRVLAHVDLDVQIAGLRACGAGLAFARKTNAVAAIDAGGNLHREFLLVLDPPFAVAGLARIRDLLAAAAAMRTRLLDRENPVLHAHATVTLAGLAGFELAVGGTRALAFFTTRQRRYADLLFRAEYGFFQIQFEDVAQIRAASRLARAAATEDVAKDIAEDVAHVGEPAAAPARTLLEGGVAMAVVERALVRVAEDFVSLFRFLEMRLAFLVAGIAVRMVFHRQTTERGFQFAVAGAALDRKDFVVIALAHVDPVWPEAPSVKASSLPFSMPSPKKTAPDEPGAWSVVYCLPSFTSVNSASTTSSFGAEPPDACAPASPPA